jgi:hypothetical protein
MSFLVKKHYNETVRCVCSPYDLSENTMGSIMLFDIVFLFKMLSVIKQCTCNGIEQLLTVYLKKG